MSQTASGLDPFRHDPCLPRGYLPLKWNKHEEEPTLEPPEDDGPLDYIIDGDAIAEEELQEEERKGVFHGLRCAIRSFVSGEDAEDGADAEYVPPPADERIIFQTDRELKITSMNEQARRFFGMGDEILNRSIMGTVMTKNDESMKVLLRVKGALLDDNERFQSVVVRGYDRSSKIVWLNYSVEALRDEQCGLIGILWTGRDITDSVLMSYNDEAITVDAFRSTIESVPNPIMVIGMGRVIVAWNDHLLKMFGLEPDKDIITAESLLSVLLLNVKDHRSFVDRVIRLSDVKDDRALTIDLKDGRKFICNNKSSEIKGYEDCVVWSFQQAPSQGRWMEHDGADRPEVHMDDIPDLLWEVDASHKILYASPGLENILSHRPDDMVGYDLLNFVIPDDRIMLRSLLSKEISSVQQAEVRMLKADGSVAWME
ncbi:MAG TPA: PAS domain S-box protein, partial [Methanomassiliicoccales archaeon]|nr:PAS domain S-box protein [Methanomassiliicoccales archaeon]